jgi:hypothetical protein
MHGWGAWRGVGGSVAVAAAAVMLVSCATGKKDEEPEQQTGKRPRLVGRVASMPKDQDFVLLQSYGAWSVPPGVPVYCVGPEGRLANLLPSGEKMGQFVAADVRDGAVQVGDAVYYRPSGEAPAASGQEGAGNGGNAGPSEVAEDANGASTGSIEPDLPR